MTDKKNLLGSIAGRILLLFAKGRKVTDKDALQSEFRTSTQKMGVSFTEKIRNVFRHRWIK